MNLRFYCLLYFLLLFNQADAQNKTVVATASIFADMASNIGGNLIEVKSIVPIGGDPHIFEPTPADAQLVAGADLILRNGLTFEGWLNELIDNSGTKAEVVLITEGITPIESEQYENSADPHAWMDAQNGLIYLENIKNALIKLAPEHQQAFEFNYGIYRDQLMEMDQTIKEAILRIPESQRILITSHDAFRYYGKAYGIRVEAVLGTSTDADIQTSDIIRLNKIIKENNLHAVFIESTVNPKMLQQLAKDNKIAIGGKLYSDSIGDQDSPAPTYLKMLEFNTKTIVDALSANVESPLETESSQPNFTPILMGLVLGLILLGGFIMVYRRLA